ncbi:MAG TPA: peptidoglycan editing factor PgeF [Croceibacterium sp.]|nr:peptidoglycan editing factor PgeF [Croceibacterium sp.]
MAEAVPQGVEIIRSRALGGIPHGFLGRRGGVSQGAVAGLNVGLGAGDDDDAVAENRRRAAAAVMADGALATVYQIHSPDAVCVESPWPVEERPRADAMVTATPDVLLGVVTADCAPVLLADAEAGVVGAAHAGWRGAHGGVLENTVAVMERLGAKRGRIAAAIGPAIARQSYEVDDGFRAGFCESADHFFTAGRAGHWQFDLEGYATSRLAAAGVTTIDALGLDTYADEERFFSYRRATHRGEAAYGRQFSLIGLTR